ncbi:MAG: DUF3422 family protein [Beijerinckiaceae bacterium]
MMSDTHEPASPAAGNTGLVEYRLRNAVLGELHARPFHAVAAPGRVLHLGLMNSKANRAAAHEALSAFCLANGAPQPQPQANHHRITTAHFALSWEQHTEFSTFTWFFEGEAARRADSASTLYRSCAAGLEQPGPVIVAVDLHVWTDAVPHPPTAALPAAASRLMQSAARVETDFAAGPDGFVRLDLTVRDLGNRALGALVQRLLEIETYRTFALLGLPEAQRVAPTVRRIEKEVAEISRTMTLAEGLEANRKLLDRLTSMAAEAEAEAAQSSYRFAASRAYDEIVHQRLEIIGEEPIPDVPTMKAFLDRRMAPAIRTCLAMADRQADLSRKLTRAANLLRTRVDVEMEQQNRDLLQSMNDRTRLQLRLQQTVEGLSVMAISYYAVGLLGYVFKGMKDAGALPFEPSIATALSVPVAMMLVWMMVRRIRKHHAAD